MKKIICPTDFSKPALNATAYAAKFAHAIGAQLTLFHVQSLVEKLPAELIGGVSLTDSEYKTELEKQSFEISRTFKISCYSEVVPLSSSVAKTIAERANTFDLLIMGTRADHGLFQFLTGSNTYRAVRDTKVPTLVVPPGCLYSEIKSIVFGFDYLRERRLPIAQLVPFVQILNAELTVLQVMEKAHSLDMEDDLHELQLMLTEKYSDKIKFRFDEVRSSAVASSINTYVSENQPDVLAMCSIHHNFPEKLFHKSVFKDLSVVAKYPVFVFHE